METLIANSGIQFCNIDLELNLSEPLVFDNGKTLKYSFLEIKDFITEEVTLDFAYMHNQPDGQYYIPLKEIKEYDDSSLFKQSQAGRILRNQFGLPKVKSEEFSTALFSSYPSGAPEIININSLESYKIKNNETHENVPAYQYFLNKWLPMPMYEKDVDGQTNDYPLAWCRLKIFDMGPGRQKETRKYRFVWAFDTKVTDDPLSVFQPYFDSMESAKEYGLCNNVEQLLSFMSVSDEFHAFSDYIKSLLNISPTEVSFKYVSYYIYFINYIRLIGASPEVKMYYSEDEKSNVDVDLVLDIGNSRTFGILFEKGDFTRSNQLALRDLSYPWNIYENAFDMRFVFRKADFGNAIVFGPELDSIFTWPSMVRVGVEAKNLIYESREDTGESEKTTNYSSPKRYLWDDEPYFGAWEFLTTNSDPINLQLEQNIYIPVLSDMFDSDGRYYPEGTFPPINFSDPTAKSIHYSRSSLMTFVLIEVLQQAVCQINSRAFREKGDINLKRVLRNIIITCPTAMPIAEQIKLRRCAEEAYDAVARCTHVAHPARVIPSSASLRVADNDEGPIQRDWSYDEASCSQLVYLYAEIAQRYRGEIHQFFELKGHVRPEDAAEGLKNKSLTLASVDIGAGTTDIIINNYRYDGTGVSLVSPRPIFWDSYYLAGDEILKKVIFNEVIEGPNLDSPELGTIKSALVYRMLHMSLDEMGKLPCLTKSYRSPVYQKTYEGILTAYTDEERLTRIENWAIDLIHDYFAQSSEHMKARDRRCRVDFNTQILQPMGQFFLEKLRLNRPSKVFSYEDIFPTVKPSEHLLNHFADHFGFRFEELRWRFDPRSVASDVCDTIEPLMKTLAQVIYMHHCDILVLSGRPSSLRALTELFVKYIPLSPHRIICLNDYRVGEWYPGNLVTGQGFFVDQKSIVAVGGMIGFQASHGNFNAGREDMGYDLTLDFKDMIKQMKSTALYMGEYKTEYQQIRSSMLTPQKSSARLVVYKFPAYIGCSQFDSQSYQARPIYALYSNNPEVGPLTISLSRNYHDNREELIIESITNSQGDELPPDAVKLVQQSIVEGKKGEYWLDTGIFSIIINAKH